MGEEHRGAGTRRKIANQAENQSEFTENRGGVHSERINTAAKQSPHRDHTVLDGTTVDNLGELADMRKHHAAKLFH